MNIIVTELVGKRLLMKISKNFYANEVAEFKVLEVSPSGNWIKLMDLNGRRYWKHMSETIFIEELHPLVRLPQ